MDQYPGAGNRGKISQELVQGGGVVEDVSPDLYDKEFGHAFRDFRMSASTAWAAQTRLPASRVTRLWGPSSISSLSSTFRRTGKQCITRALLVGFSLSSVSIQSGSLLYILP